MICLHLVHINFFFNFSRPACYLCGLVAEWLGAWTCDQQVGDSNPVCHAAECNPAQAAYIHAPQSPSSIIWYQPMGGDARRLGR